MVHARPCKSGCFVLFILCIITILVIEYKYFNKRPIDCYSEGVSRKTIFIETGPYELKVFEDIDPKTHVPRYTCVEYFNTNLWISRPKDKNLKQ